MSAQSSVTRQARKGRRSARLAGVLLTVAALAGCGPVVGGECLEGYVPAGTRCVPAGDTADKPGEAGGGAGAGVPVGGAGGGGSGAGAGAGGAGASGAGASGAGASGAG
ncbi:MAG: hypothetical protein HY744_06230, partial [Deltaproteobacteria bacterium]|nr:hypothetical protein [Deltaproteobacteria bacterium]